MQNKVSKFGTDAHLSFQKLRDRSYFIHATFFYGLLLI